MNYVCQFTILIVKLNDFSVRLMIICKFIPALFQNEKVQTYLTGQIWPRFSHVRAGKNYKPIDGQAPEKPCSGQPAHWEGNGSQPPATYQQAHATPCQTAKSSHSRRQLQKQAVICWWQLTVTQERSNMDSHWLELSEM